MAIQTRQQVNGRTIGLWRIVGVTVGIVAVSAALVASGLGWQRVTTPQVRSEAPIAAMQQSPLGIDLPHGADIRELLAGITDYLRAGERPVTMAMEQHPLGIALPQGAAAQDLPAGLTDYLRPQQADQPVVAQPQTRRYLLGGHGELVAGVSNAQAASRFTAASPALIGTGSAYDGQMYLAVRPATRNYPIRTAASSAYDGQPYR